MFSKLLAAGPLVTASEIVRMTSAAAVATSAVIEYIRRRSGAPGRRAAQTRWTEEALKRALRDLSGRQVIVVANREPCVHEFDADGAVRVKRPASGLVTALDPVMRACEGGVWVAHGSGSADRVMADRHGRLKIDAGESSYQLRRVWLTADEERGYYYGVANEGLWPLCHLSFTAPVFRRSDWAHYEAVNRRFADAVAAEVTSPDPIVLVQDYHFTLVPRLLRERCPLATIVTFWHIPWPNAERFAICPYGEAVVDGLLGSSIVGFQTPGHCLNFMETVERLVDARPDWRTRSVACHGVETLVRPYPISIEWPSRFAATAPPVRECRRAVYSEFGLDSAQRLVVSVDRLDYTKGIEERLAAMEHLVARDADRRVVLLQVASPSRVQIRGYREYAERVRARVDAINARFRTEHYTPVIYLDRYTQPEEVFRYYRAADACYVGSLDDGMNLVAKEFVAARDDELGVLVLSRFAGCAQELDAALIVNPYDSDSVADAIAAAVRMPPAEQRRRMRAMRAHVADWNVYRWAARMLMDAAQLGAEQIASRVPVESSPAIAHAF